MNHPRRSVPFASSRDWPSGIRFVPVGNEVGDTEAIEDGLPDSPTVFFDRLVHVIGDGTARTRRHRVELCVQPRSVGELEDVVDIGLFNVDQSSLEIAEERVSCLDAKAPAAVELFRNSISAALTGPSRRNASTGATWSNEAPCQPSSHIASRPNNCPANRGGRDLETWHPATIKAVMLARTDQKHGSWITRPAAMATRDELSVPW